MQTILITGATAGIGRDAALHLADQGHHVIATGRNAAALDELSTYKPKGDGRLDVLQLDVTSASSIASAQQAVDRLTAGRGIDALVNNAGYGLPGPLVEIPDAELRAQFDTNVFGLMAVTRAFVPQMRARGGGRVVNISSIGGRVTFPMFGAYHASKYAVEALSDALRMELSAFGIAVSLVEPGPIRTEFSDRSLREIAKVQSQTSPYAAIYARADAIAQQAAARSPGPAVVSRAIEHAIVARRPRARYVVPFHIGVGVAFLRLLPTRVVDFVMTRYLGLTRRRLVAPVKTPALASS